MYLGRVLARRLYSSKTDTHEAFESFVVARTPPGAVVLDCGCGAGRKFPEKLRLSAARICGIDPDPAALGNPHLDEVRACPAGRILYPDRTFDLVFCKYVLEHLQFPEAAFREIRRVLKPGARFVFLTPNAYHYAALASLATPTWFHAAVNRIRDAGEMTSFPVYYRANTRRRISSLCEETGLVLEEMVFHEPRPAYLEPIWPLFLVGAFYERIVSGFDCLSALRFNMMGLATRP